MRILLIILISLSLTTPCIAEQWYCISHQSLMFARDKVSKECKAYSGYRLKKPIVSRSNKKYNSIVETFDDRRAKRNCIYN